jgi:hypothetical protein
MGKSMEAQKTWKPTVAGMINIAVGAVYIVVFSLLIIGIMLSEGDFRIPDTIYIRKDPVEPTIV